jgi:N-acetylmuramoyl-L-alanine amidase
MSDNFKDMKSIEYIAIHCSATQAKSKLTAKDIDLMHRKRGWFSIGYHYVIRRDGVVEDGRPMPKMGAHVSGYNDVAVGVCLVGGVDANLKPENNFTAWQMASLAELVIKLKKEYPDAVVQGHRDFPNVAKACPCFEVKEWYAEVVEGREVCETCGKEL